MRSIAIASGKGGVGKTNITVNLGLALARMGKRVVIVDADIVMANLGLTLGVDRAPISIHHVLAGEAEMKDAIYEGPENIRFVPAGLSMEKLRKVDYQRLKSAIAELAPLTDFVLVDNPSGLAVDAESALKSCNEVLLVCTPEPAALADCIKVKNTAERNNIDVVGVIYNMMLGDASEISPRDVETVLETKVLAAIPLDARVRKASSLQKPVVMQFPDSPFSKAMFAVAAKITGEKEIALPAAQGSGLVDRLVNSFRQFLDKLGLKMGKNA